MYQRQRHVFDSPDRFVVGTVGQPGERDFYLQASSRGQVVTVGLEKAEVNALAEGLTTLLGQVRRVGGELPEVRDVDVDLAPLDAPFEEDFHLGRLTVSWDGKRVLVEAAGLAAGGARRLDADAELDTLEVSLSLDQTKAFVQRARSIVAAGRPSCVLCGRPDDPSGHFCPRLN
ncbi:hypothetical protein FDG2_2639 [Candidatus Protofrankia californiensis]|uniref:DUF3090 domain-containing protein n=1 Tax=Candidatus Protofrankia californiensis TaxID=1839754 RepID=A0A1C3NY36_9ACTN|nr:hypothetical protein FDG2_2639 [Candidatus Protofrankia californiensis]